MIYFLTASKDATLYSGDLNKNTGLDQIIEVSNLSGDIISNDISRAVIKFDISNFQSMISSNQINPADVRLVLRETNTSMVPLEYQLHINPISGSWEMGNGYLYEYVNNTGVSWKYRNVTNQTYWNTGQYTVSSTGSNLDGRGGVWYTNYTVSQSYSYMSSDLDVSIKNIFDGWLSGSIINNGLLLQLAPTYEYSNSNIKLNFFSKETNTIYQPKLCIGWDDSIFNTGSLIPIVSDNIKVSVTNISEKYQSGNTYRFNVVGSELYPVKTFTNTFQYNIKKYLPINTYYQVRDLLSNVVIVPFSNFTKVSCDSAGNFIKLNLDSWQSNRKYKFEFKIGNDNIHYYNDNNNIFEIVK